MGRGSARAYALFVCFVAATASPAVGQTGPGWGSRFDGKAIAASGTASGRATGG